ncbi:MAG: hypothetical protein V4750_04695 [Pseudomonadota bacterium]
MKLTRVFTNEVPKPAPIAPWRTLLAWIAALPVRRVAPPRVDAPDFQDTQPSIRDAGPTLS